MRIDIHHIRAFLAVADALQFNVAADRMHMTQPALSRIIKALEESVGAALLARTTRRVELTDAGRVFAEHCQLALAHIDQAVSLARRAEAGNVGHLRIAYMDFAINGALPALIEAFGKKFPSINIDLVHMPSTVQKQAMLDSTIDVGFMIGPFAAPGVQTRVFGREQMVALLPTAHPLTQKKTLKLTDLADERFVLGTPHSWEAFRHHFFSICHRAGFAPTIAQEASTSDGIIGLVAANTGVSVYPECIRNIQRSGLCIRPLTDRDTAIDMVVCWRGDTRNPSVNTFIGELKVAEARSRKEVAAHG
ncbi:LysR family transcriptional regulator [Burkholderia sp. KK1]|uniref:LysR family transcriptional regulator n=2 Tax=Caballeronia cordobensis TaxID=1353886 RepID=A0A158IXD9_CABCO|nr:MULTISPECIES: LysR family transcriptional regulator [Caballeronia]AQH03027.1 LysR family transcriptional regulator [Burkholderia sp. KK1]BAO90655.1 LysR family transcriptional regulator [Burkholderia sp. RPE67]BBQ00685.1 LysR family transcriptional regulator [Burkholderia sp. SFA1]MCE4573838.1 LysR family transcriptional regulator [Caballeronia sp. CLC5]SAL60721.1 LysR family transcriptional regulator [Caballeronia cordobensis]